MGAIPALVRILRNPVIITNKKSVAPSTGNDSRFQTIPKPSAKFSAYRIKIAASSNGTALKSTLIKVTDVIKSKTNQFCPVLECFIKFKTEILRFTGCRKFTIL